MQVLIKEVARNIAKYLKPKTLERFIPVSIFINKYSSLKNIKVFKIIIRLNNQINVYSD